MVDNPFPPGGLHAHNRQAERDRAERIPATREQVAAIIEALPQLVEHKEHGGWHQAGRCIYCGCGARMFQGRLANVQ